MNNIHGIKDSANISILDKKSRKPLIFANYATDIQNTWKTSQVYAKSKSTKAIRWDFDKDTTLKMTMEIFDLRWLSMLTGSDFKKGKTEIFKREVLPVGEDNSVVLSAEPKVGSLSIFTLQEDNLTNGVEQTVGDTTSENTYKVDASDKKKLSFNAKSCPKGSKIVAYYMTETGENAMKMIVQADKFPNAVEIFMDTMVRDTDQEDKFVQLHYFTAKAKGDFTLTMSASNITKLEIEFDILKDSTSEDMMEYTLIQ